MSRREVILVTGAPRSGTTVVGEYLLSSWRIRELYEPMNVNVGDRSIRNQFEVPGSQDFPATALDDLHDRIVRGRLRLRRANNARRNRYLNRTNRTMLAANVAPFASHLIWKDPFAFFCAPQLARKGVPVIVTVRDHLSLVGSFKRMEWSAPVASLSQRMREAGLTVNDEIFAQCQTAEGHAYTGALMWHLLHSALVGWMEAGEPLAVLENTELLDNPAQAAATLTKVTGIPVTIERQEEPQETQPDADLPTKAHIKNRDAKSITDYWRKVLSDEEVEQTLALNAELMERLRAALGS